MDSFTLTIRNERAARVLIDEFADAVGLSPFEWQKLYELGDAVMQLGYDAGYERGVEDEAAEQQN